MGSRSFSDYGIDPLGLSGEENEQVADLIEQNSDLLNEVRGSRRPLAAWLCLEQPTAAVLTVPSAGTTYELACGRL